MISLVTVVLLTVRLSVQIVVDKRFSQPLKRVVCEGFHTRVGLQVTGQAHLKVMRRSAIY